MWFDRHPGASVRVREALPGEHDPQAFWRDELAPDEKGVVVVVQAAPGRRARLPFKVVTTSAPGARLSPQQLEEVRAEWESGDRTALVTGMDGRGVDTLAMFRRVVTREAMSES
ncbi:hypothetical protein [Streptomyces sp. NBC_00057]|uniref:hypothetical protein n=1 Tax=Streptomyces sp. NBC_00057 TaxID=2975634 RepID=UPI0032557216